jgi:signal transduction histidine kinase
MKLLVKTNIYNLLLSIPILALACFFSYRIIEDEIIKSTDEMLLNELSSAQQFINKNDTLSNYSWGFNKVNSIQKITHSDLTKNRFYDTLVFNTKEAEFEPYRLLKSAYANKTGTYAITLKKATIESDDLLVGIVKAIVILLALLFSSFIMLNSLINKKIWQPFYQTLKSLKEFEIKKASTINTTSTGIKEFDDLNRSLGLMTSKIAKDYHSQKQFTENAAHEIQTPLAIIKSKIELLVQSPSIQEADIASILSIYEAANRLSNLNKGLLLLSKIENKQFSNVKQIKLSVIINDLIENYNDLISLKKLKLEMNVHSELTVQMHPALCEIMISNLLLNAIKHNDIGGSIAIILNSDTFTIANTGKCLEISEDEIFMRFKKNNPASESLGLGLAIVKEITTHYHYTINYTYSEIQHFFTIHFLQSK